MSITKSQVKEARRLLGWSKRALATKISTDFNAVHAYEIEGSIAAGFDPEQARSAFEAAGVDFSAGSAGGTRVRFRNPEPAPFQVGVKVKFREGVTPPGARNMGVVGEVLARAASLTGHVMVRWPTGEEAEAKSAHLEIASAPLN